MDSGKFKALTKDAIPSKLTSKNTSLILRSRIRKW